MSITLLLLQINFLQDLAAFSSQSCTVFHANDLTRDIEDLLTPSTLNTATSSNVDLGC